ncbi:MAG: acyl--CoA ligase, partial [Dehalococcoidia bacterium]|nr:acyl--CoA ligase [Dehalococcoidia bacterium]
MSAMLPDWLTHRARALPRVTAISSGRRRGLSYAALFEYAVRQANAFAAAGAAPGERIATIAGTSRDFVVAMHATGLTGAIFVPLNIRLTAAELAEQLRNAEPTVVLCDKPHEALATEAAALAGCPLPLRLPL